MTVAGNIEHGLIGSRFENETAEQKRARIIEAAKLANRRGEEDWFLRDQADLVAKVSDVPFLDRNAVNLDDAANGVLRNCSPAVQVLYNFNGIFPPGKMTALVGGSGSGT
jgi:ABC-type glutathione transport system ATPase component